MIRNYLPFILAIIVSLTIPAVGWAGTTAEGDFFDSAISVPSTDYENLAKAAEALNELAVVGPDGNPITSLANDLNIRIHLTGDESIDGVGGTGSAIALDGVRYDVDGNPNIIRGFNNITIDGLEHSLNGNDSATGTLLSIANASGDISISNLNFLNGDAKEDEHDDPSVMTYGGTGLMINPNGVPYPSSGFQNVHLTNVLIQNNHGTFTGGATSGGGGMTIYNAGGGTLTMTDFDLVENTSEAKGGTFGIGDSNAFGGGGGLANLETIEYLGGRVSGNQALSDGGLIAAGGGLHVSSRYTYSADFAGVEFSGNTARISQGSRSSSNPIKTLGGAYYGEAAFFQSNINDIATTSFSDGVAFSDNKAEAIGDYAEAYGGAAAFILGIDASFDGVAFTDNTADATLGSGAYGGAVYTQASASFVNSGFTGNSAAGAAAYGGAIFMDASVNTNAAVTESVLNMVVEADRTVAISGNTAAGQASGVHFGNAWADLSEKDGVFNIRNDGRMEIRDPLTVDLNNGKFFTMKVEGEGALVLGGENIISAAGGTEIDFSQAATELTRDFSLVVINNPASNFVMNLTQAGADQNSFTFDSRRDSAMIDISEAGDNKNFLVAPAATTIDISDTRRQLLDYQKSLVIVKGVGAYADNLADQLNTQSFGQNLLGSYFTASGGDVMLEMRYSSPFMDDLIQAGRNTASAVPALNELLQYDDLYEGMSDEAALDIIHANYNALTPEYGAAAGAMGLDVARFVSGAAVRQGLKARRGTSLSTPLCTRDRVGVWAGFAGNYRDVDNDGGYYGYDQKTSAALVGVNYDLGPAAAVGIFGGYSRNKADLDSLDSEVKSDGYHFGLMARLSPGASEDRRPFSLYFDAAYGHYDNDGYRRMGPGKTTGSFDQTAYTAGVGAEYALQLGERFRLAPSLDLRYTRLEQDGYSEKGLTASRVEKYDLDSFTSLLAVTVSREFAFDNGVVTPSAHIGWNHEYGDTDVRTTARYLAPGGGLVPGAYALGTVKRNRDSMNAGAAIDLLMNTGGCNQFGLHVSYDIDVSKNATNHRVYGGLEVRF